MTQGILDIHLNFKKKTILPNNCYKLTKCLLIFTCVFKEIACSNLRYKDMMDLILPSPLYLFEQNLKKNTI